jgi:hypothetical protein
MDSEKAICTAEQSMKYRLASDAHTKFSGNPVYNQVKG